MDNPQIYGLEFQARALTSQQYESETIKFIVGTQCLKMHQNQIHLIEVSDDNTNLIPKIIPHSSGEIWHISASPHDPALITTCFNFADGNNCSMKSSMWKLDSNLELLDTIPSETIGSDVKQTLFHPTDANKLLSIIDNKFAIWDTGEANIKLASTGVLDAKGQPKFTVGKWNPHHSVTQIATCNESHVRGWDVRNSSQVWCIESAHTQVVRDLDFNPNKQYYLATCGDDGFTRYWDIRNTQESIVSRADHSHWVWAVRYNHFHDQLVLTASSDSRVILTCVSGISSEPDGLHLASDEESYESTNQKLEDGILCRYETHEDSVYVVEWSTSDPWTFASLSYDGRLVINTVPKSFKFKILL